MPLNSVRGSSQLSPNLPPIDLTQTPTLRQRLMEPSRIILQQPLLHTGVGGTQSVSSIPLQPPPSGGPVINNKTQEVSTCKPSTKSKIQSSVITNAVPIYLNMGAKPTTSTLANVPHLPVLKPKTVLHKHLQTLPGQQKIAPKPAEVSIQYYPQQQPIVQLNINDSTNPNLIKSLLAKKLNQNLVVKQSQPLTSQNNVPVTTSPLLILSDPVSVTSQSVTDVAQTQVPGIGFQHVTMKYEFDQHNSNQNTDSVLHVHSVSSQHQSPHSVNAIQTVSSCHSNPLSNVFSEKIAKKKKGENSRKETCSPCQTSPIVSVKLPISISASQPSSSSNSQSSSPQSASPQLPSYELEVCGKVERAKDIVQTGAETLIERVENKCLEQLHELQKQISKPSIRCSSVQNCELSLVASSLNEEKPRTKNGINVSNAHSPTHSENSLDTSMIVSDSCANSLNVLSAPNSTVNIKIPFVDNTVRNVSGQHKAKVMRKTFGKCESFNENILHEQNPLGKCNMTNNKSFDITNVTLNDVENVSSQSMEIDYLNDQNSFLANANSIPTGLENGLNSPLDSPSSIDQDMPSSPVSEMKENGTIFNGQEMDSCKSDAANSLSERKEKWSDLIEKVPKINGIVIHLGNGDHSVEEDMDVDGKKDFLERDIEQKIFMHGQSVTCSGVETSIRSQSSPSYSAVSSVNSTAMFVNCRMTGNGFEKSPATLQSLMPEQKTFLLKANLQFKHKREKTEISIDKVLDHKICDTRHIPIPDTRDGELSSDSFASSTAESVSEKYSTPEALTGQTFNVDSDKSDNTVSNILGEKKVKPRKRNRSNASIGSSEPKSPAVMIPIGPQFICEWDGCKK